MSRPGTPLASRWTVAHESPERTNDLGLLLHLGTMPLKRRARGRISTAAQRRCPIGRRADHPPFLPSNHSTLTITVGQPPSIAIYRPPSTDEATQCGIGRARKVFATRQVRRRRACLGENNPEQLSRVATSTSSARGGARYLRAVREGCTRRSTKDIMGTLQTLLLLLLKQLGFSNLVEHSKRPCRCALQFWPSSGQLLSGGLPTARDDGTNRRALNRASPTASMNCCPGTWPASCPRTLTYPRLLPDCRPVRTR